MLKALDPSDPAAFDAASRVVARWNLQEALPVLADALSSDNPWVVEHAARSLGQMGTSAAGVISKLEQQFASSTNPQVRASIKGALNDIQDSTKSEMAPVTPKSIR